MKQQFYCTPKLTVRELKALWVRLYPWAARCIKADGGYWFFESIDGYKTWKNNGNERGKDE